MLRAVAVASVLVLASPALAEPINTVVGDASWIERYGRPPTAEDDRLRDAERHRVHLAWIEGRLRARDVSHLSPELRARRAMLLDALADYRRRGEKPINEHFAGRRPRFIDDEGRICAVGYLIEVSAGRALAEHIDAHHEHDYLLDIHDAGLDAWIASSGFTAEELASIQPGYSEEINQIIYGVIAAPIGLVELPFLVYDIESEAQDGRRIDQGVAAGQLVAGAAAGALLTALWMALLDGDRVSDPGWAAVAAVLSIVDAWVVGYAIAALADPHTSTTSITGPL
jgi:hypothetical protein